MKILSMDCNYNHLLAGMHMKVYKWYFSSGPGDEKFLFSGVIRFIVQETDRMLTF